MTRGAARAAVRRRRPARGAGRATIRGAARAAAAGLLVTIAAPAAGQPPPPDAMVQVRPADETGGSAPLLGFVAGADGHVVAQIVAGDAGHVVGADFAVRLAGGVEHVVAEGVAYDDASGLGLLRLTTDPPPAPYPFARDPAETGRAVFGVTVDADTGEAVVRSGSISRIIEPASSSDPADPATIRHNALAGERRHGAPLFNNCGQVVGVIVERAAETPGSARAAPAEWLVETFGDDGLAPVRVEEVCLSDAEQVAASEQARVEAEEQTAAAQAAAEEAEAARAAAQEQAEAERAAAEEQTAAAQAAAEEAEAERAAAELQVAEAEQVRLELEARADEAWRNQAAAEQARAAAAADAAAAAERAEAAERDRQATRRYAAWAAAAGGASSALLLGLWLAARRSRARAARAGRAAAAEASAARTAMAARAAAEQEAAAVPDVVLTGTDPEGRPVSLRVPGRVVAGRSGAVVGRSPFDGEVVLNHPEVSRRHFRLFRADGTLMVEDLGSMNGTALDGVPLVAGAGQPLAAGARLRVGQIEFTMRTPAGDGGEGDGS